MAIRNLGEMQNIFNSYDSKAWTKSAIIEKVDDPNINFNSPINEINSPKNALSFGEVLAKSLSDVNGLQEQANVAIQKLASGKSKNLHETLLAVERADIALKQMNQIRMKVVDAYKEIMRMQV